MVPDIYTREESALEHRNALLREAEQERMLAGSPTYASHALQRLTGRLGMFLIALGAGLQRFEQHGQAVK